MWKIFISNYNTGFLHVYHSITFLIASHLLYRLCSKMFFCYVFNGIFEMFLFYFFNIRFTLYFVWFWVRRFSRQLLNYNSKCLLMRFYIYIEIITHEWKLSHSWLPYSYLHQRKAIYYIVHYTTILWLPQPFILWKNNK